MAAAVDKVFLLGQLVRDPELRYTASGTAMAALRLAVNRHLPNGADGSRREETLFVTCVGWDKAAENVAQYLSRGSSLMVEGRLRSRDFEGRDGQRRPVLEVVGERVQFLDRRQAAGAPAAPAPDASPATDSPF